MIAVASALVGWGEVHGGVGAGGDRRVGRCGADRPHGAAGAGLEVDRQDEVGVEGGHELGALLFEVTPDELVGLAGEMFGALVERAVEPLDLFTVERDGAHRLAVGAAQRDAPGGAPTRSHRSGAPAASDKGGRCEPRAASRARVW